MTSAGNAADLGPDEFAVESPVQIVAKSSLWQGFLRTASVLSTSLLFELFSKLLENGVGQSAAVASASSWLGRIGILVVVAAAVYLVVRRLTTMGERLRMRRELRLTADLIAPGAPVRSWSAAGQNVVEERAAQAVPSREDCVELWRAKVVQVLRALPFEEYETAALYDMTSAILTVRRRLPDARVPQPASAKLEIDKLTRAGILVQISGDRVRVRRGRIARVRAQWMLGQCEEWKPGRPWRPGAEPGIGEQPEWDAALPALVHHYADRARRWATALDTRRLGAGAQRWFAQEAGHLVDLIHDCAAIDTAGGRRAVRAAVVPELLQIADALDRWYARNGWHAAEKQLARLISTLVTAEGQPVEYSLANIRAGTPDDGPAVSLLHRYWAPLTARRDESRAWDLLAAAPDPGTLQEAGRLLERAWRRLPARDAAGSVCLLVDLSIVRLHEGRLDAARNCLAVAQTLTGVDRDPVGLAHIYETLGVLRWIRGEPRRALHDWQRALSRFRDLNHALGTARCLQHLGSAMAAFPEYGGLLLDGELTRGEVLRQAGGWLAESMQIRESIGSQGRIGGSPATNRPPGAQSGPVEVEVPAADARRRVYEDLASGSGLFDPTLGAPAELLLRRIDRWPLPAPEDAATPSRES